MKSIIAGVPWLSHLAIALLQYLPMRTYVICGLSLWFVACSAQSGPAPQADAAAPDPVPTGPAITKILDSHGEVHIGGRFGSTGSIVVDGDWLQTLGDASAITQARGVMTMQVYADSRLYIWSPGDHPWVRVDRGRVLAYVHPGVQARFFGRGITATTTDSKSASIVYFDSELLDPYVSWYEGGGEVTNGAVTQATGTGYAAALTYETRYRKFFPARRDFYTPADAERVRRIDREQAVR